jgi:hypothetical protein
MVAFRDVADVVAGVVESHRGSIVRTFSSGTNSRKAPGLR